jgi:hypothetical protein
MLAALLDAGASVIAGPGANFAGRSRLLGSDVLGRRLRVLLSLGIPAGQALAAAKRSLAKRARRDPTIADTMKFRLYA